MKFDTIIKIPENIEINQLGNDEGKNLNSLNSTYIIRGPLGSSSINLKNLDKDGNAAIHFDFEKRQIIIRSLHPKYNGLYKKLLENKFIGVTRGFCIYLEIIGVGYRASLISSNSVDPTSKLGADGIENKNDILVLKLGHSHDIHYTIPKGVRVFLQSPSEISVFGLDLNQVTQIASSIRATRKPSVYKGKGVRLSTEKIITKAGKR